MAKDAGRMPALPGATENLRQDAGADERLVGEEAGLSCGCGGGFAAGDADDAEDGEFAEGGAGDEDAVGARV